MDRNREVNIETNTKPQIQSLPVRQSTSDEEVRINKMTPADIKGATEKNKTIEDTPAPREEQAP